MKIIQAMFTGLFVLARISSIEAAEEKVCKTSKARIGECFTAHGYVNFLPADGVVAFSPEKEDIDEYYLEDYQPKEWKAMGSPSDLVGNFEICPVKPSARVLADMTRLGSADKKAACIEKIIDGMPTPDDDVSGEKFCKMVPWECPAEKKP